MTTTRGRARNAAASCTTPAKADAAIERAYGVKYSQPAAPVSDMLRMSDETLYEESETVKVCLRASPKGGVTAFQCISLELRRARSEESRFRAENEALRHEVAETDEHASKMEALVNAKNSDLAAKDARIAELEREKKGKLAYAQCKAAECAMDECLKIWSDAHRARQVFDAIMALEIS